MHDKRLKQAIEEGVAKGVPTDDPATPISSEQDGMGHVGGDRQQHAELNAAYAHVVAQQLLGLPAEEAAFRELESYQQPEVDPGKHRFPKKHYLVIGAGLLAVPLAVLFWFVCMVFLPSPTIHYSFAQTNNCVVSPTLFPRKFTSDPRATFAVTRKPSVSVFGHAIFSYRLCATPQQKFLAKTSYKNSQSVAILGLHLKKSATIITGAYPALSSVNLDAKAMLLLPPVQFKLSSTDTTFDYAVMVNGAMADCSKRARMVSCDLAPLKLAYGMDYKVALVRKFHQQVAGTVLTKAVKTITATGIAQTSIAAGTVVYDTPQQITLTTTKPLKGLGTVSLRSTVNGTTTTVPARVSFKGSTITILAQSALPRRAALDVHIDQVTATDQSQLERPYDLAFTTSGGPKVTGVSIPSTDVSPSASITVAFDQTLLPSQAAQPLVTLLANGAPQSASVTISANKLIITPTSSFPICAHITVKTSSAAQSQYGISGDSAWQLNARARCYTTYSIGTSARGRAITAYQFGSGTNMVLYIGAMHGNEQNSMVILQKWITALNATPDNIPAGRTLVVIPNANPDGVAANTRENANHIDLNRNFPTNNWQTVVTEPSSNGAPTNEGGPTPLSEPESQALATFIQAHRPRLMLTYHSHAGVVEANDAGDSDSLGTVYARSAGYQAIPTYAIGNTFDYSTTGAVEDWMHDKLGLPALVVELRSATADEFTLNRAAMWSMAQLPL